MFDPVSVPVEAPPRILPAERLGALAEVILCSGFPTQLVILAVMSGFGMRLQTASGSWSPLFVATLSLLDTALVIGLVLLFLRAHRERARDVLLGHAASLAGSAGGRDAPPDRVPAGAPGAGRHSSRSRRSCTTCSGTRWQDLMQNPRDAAIFGFVVMIAGGVREEIQRGFILHRFSQYLGGGAVGVIVHSALFGLGHVDQGWDATLTVGTLGAIWGTIYLTRRSIIAPMVSHAGFNLAQLVKFIALR